MNRRDYLHPNTHGRLIYLLYHIVHNIQFLILYVPSLQLLQQQDGIVLGAGCYGGARQKEAHGH